MNEEPMMDATPYTLSDQLVANDLLGGPIIVKILSVTEDRKADKPVTLEVDGVYPPYLPCKTSRRLMMGGWGKNMFKWVGKSLKLYRDPTVTYGTEEVGGVQIEQMSHMKETLVLTLIVGRNNKRRTFRIPVLDVDGPKMEDVLEAEGLTVADLDRWLAGQDKPKWSDHPEAHAGLLKYLMSGPDGFGFIRALMGEGANQ